MPMTTTARCRLAGADESGLAATRAAMGDLRTTTARRDISELSHLAEAESMLRQRWPRLTVQSADLLGMLGREMCIRKRLVPKCGDRHCWQNFS